MSAPTRTPAGVPTGGQFAATGHAEADTALEFPEAEAAASADAFDRLTVLYGQVSEAAHYAATRSLAQHYLAQNPDAVYLHLSNDEDGMTALQLTDAEFNPIGDEVDGNEEIGSNDVSHVASWIRPFRTQMMVKHPDRMHRGDLLLDLKQAAAKPIPLVPSA